MLETVLATLTDFLVFIVIFGGLFSCAGYFGVRTLENVILSIYVSLVFWFAIPFRTEMNELVGTSALAHVAVFSVLVVGTLWLMNKKFPRFDERFFDRAGKKVLYSLAGTILIMNVLYQLLSFGSVFALSLPLQQIFGSADLFFYLLIAPFIFVTFF